MGTISDGTPPKKERFLAAYAKVGVITTAADVAGCNPRAHFNWMRDDPDYPARFAAAKEQAADRAEQEIVRRAITGVDEPVYGTTYENGKPVGKKIVGHIRRYSDTLLIFWAKALRPDKFRERYEHTGHIDGPPTNLFQLIVQAQGEQPRVISADGQELIRGEDGVLRIDGPKEKTEEDPADAD